MQLNYKFIGNPKSDKLILFLHEGLGSIGQWRDYPEKLCKATNAYGLIYDRRGYGQSPGSLKDRKTDYLHRAADELATVIEQIVPDGYRIFLYGHSDGGSIALIYGANHPKTAAGIITEAAHVFVEEETIIGVREALPPFKAGKFDGLSRYHGERFKEVFMAWNSIWLNSEFRSWDITQLLPQISCPILIIQGQDDQYGTIKQVNSINELTSGESRIFMPENCGHAPYKESTEQTLKQATAFIHEY